MKVLAMNKTRSLKKQILIRLFLVTAFIFILVGAIIIERSHRVFYKSLDNAVMAQIKALLTLTEVNTDGSIDFEFNDEIMYEFNKKNAEAFFLIKRLMGNQEVARSEVLEKVKIDLPVSLKKLRKKSKFSWNLKIEDKKFRCVAKIEFPQVDEDITKSLLRGNTDNKQSNEEIINTLKKGNELLFIVGLDSSTTDERFYKAIGSTGLTLGLGLLTLLIIVWVVINRSLKPMFSLKSEVEGISADNFNLVKVPQIQEIAIVAKALNKLINRVKLAFERERQFTADVAHELRTPITEIRTLVEVMLKWRENIPESVLKNYEDIFFSIKKMQSIVTSLLTLTRCDANALKIEKETFDLSQVTREVWSQFESSAHSKNLKVNYRIPDGVNIFSDKNLFETILNNVFSNALEYTPQDGKIEFDINLQNDVFSLVVSNMTKDLTKEDLPLVFERFWRKDESRSDSDAHNGLGLALVKSISKILNFNVDVSLSENSIFTIRIYGQLGK